MRSGQLLSTRAELAAARGDLAELRSEQAADGGAGADEEPADPLDDLLNGEAGGAARACAARGWSVSTAAEPVARAGGDPASSAASAWSAFSVRSVRHSSACAAPR